MIARILFSSLLPFVIFWGVGYFFLKKESETLVVLSIIFFIGALILSFVTLMFFSQRLNVHIVGYEKGKSDGVPNMTPFAKGRFYIIAYNLQNIDYRYKMKYTSRINYSIGEYCHARKYKDFIIFEKDLFKLTFFGFFPIFMSIILLLSIPT